MTKPFGMVALRSQELDCRMKFYVTQMSNTTGERAVCTSRTRSSACERSSQRWRSPFWFTWRKWPWDYSPSVTTRRGHDHDQRWYWLIMMNYVRDEQRERRKSYLTKTPRVTRSALHISVCPVERKHFNRSRDLFIEFHSVGKATVNAYTLSERKIGGQLYRENLDSWLMRVWRTILIQVIDCKKEVTCHMDRVKLIDYFTERAISSQTYRLAVSDGTRCESMTINYLRS